MIPGPVQAAEGEGGAAPPRPHRGDCLPSCHRAPQPPLQAPPAGAAQHAHILLALQRQAMGSMSAQALRLACSICASHANLVLQLQRQPEACLAPQARLSCRSKHLTCTCLVWSCFSHTVVALTQPFASLLDGCGHRTAWTLARSRAPSWRPSSTPTTASGSAWMMVRLLYSYAHSFQTHFISRSLNSKHVDASESLHQVMSKCRALSIALPAGSKAGFFLGDGAGVGKGRQIAALILVSCSQHCLAALSPAA